MGVASRGTVAGVGDIREATRSYDRWLARHVPVVAADVERKHARMAEGVFPLLRATFYRWCQHWRSLAGAERGATRVAAIGDLHLENFGTWRDLEGRLIWGVNDFDETTRAPWSLDVVRLATSAHLAIADQQVRLRRRDASAAILAGYRAGIATGERPFVLEERNAWLRRAANSELRAPPVFWAKMDALPLARKPPADAVAALLEALPGAETRPRICRRVAGLGSLGRARLVAIADWQGGRVAREVKALPPSAWWWALGREEGQEGEEGKEGKDAAATGRRDRTPRSSDPTVRQVGRWMVRRLAPHCARVELSDLLRERDEERLLFAMGFETANVHLRTAGAGARIAADLRAGRRDARWLNELAKVFADAIEQDFRRWRAG